MRVPLAMERQPKHCPTGCPQTCVAWHVIVMFRLFENVCKPVFDTSKQVCTRPRPEVGDLSDLDEVIAASSAYSVLSFDNFLYVPSPNNTICR